VGGSRSALQPPRRGGLSTVSLAVAARLLPEDRVDSIGSSLIAKFHRFRLFDRAVRVGGN
jgi:hypothetical protein